MNEELLKIYKGFEEKTNSKVIAYVTGDRPGMQTSIGKDVVDLFGDHLESIGETQKITLILYTLGGDAMATWNLINLIREYCEQLDIIVPRKARSAGTIMCLGANKIYMTKQSTLGPIDPSVNSPLAPDIPVGNGVGGSNQKIKLPISVEHVRGYFDLAKKELGINRQKELIKPYMKLSENLHPLLLGDVYRRKEQIKTIASKLIGRKVKSKRTKKKILNFLCGDSGSHDYTISYTEAKQLKLNVELVDSELNELITNWYSHIEKEMLLRKKYDPKLEMTDINGSKKDYSHIRAIIDSISFGRHNFLSKGSLTKTEQNNQKRFNDYRNFEGWIKDDNF